MRIFKLNTQIRNKRFHHENQSFSEDDWHIFYKNQIEFLKMHSKDL